LARKNHITDRLDEARLTKGGVVSIAVPSLKLFDSLMDAKTVLDSFGIQNEVSIVAAHWAPKKTLRFIAELESKGVEVIIAALSLSSHSKYLQPGDVVEVAIESLGKIQNRVIFAD
jgi:hypothetical protein